MAALLLNYHQQTPLFLMSFMMVESMAQRIQCFVLILIDSKPTCIQPTLSARMGMHDLGDIPFQQNGHFEK